VPGKEKADKAFLLNTKMVRDGYASFDQMKPNTKYDDNLKKAPDDRKVEAGRVVGGVRRESFCAHLPRLHGQGEQVPP
jgi:hypothetical protein